LFLGISRDSYCSFAILFLFGVVYSISISVIFNIIYCYASVYQFYCILHNYIIIRRCIEVFIHRYQWSWILLYLSDFTILFLISRRGNLIIAISMRILMGPFLHSDILDFLALGVIGYPKIPSYLHFSGFQNVADTENILVPVIPSELCGSQKNRISFVSNHNG